jgi:hypothetical protein
VNKSQTAEGNKCSAERLMIPTGRRPTCFFARLVRRCGKQSTLPSPKLYSSVEDDTCGRIALILLPFHSKCPFLKPRSLKDALTSTVSPLEQAFTYAAVCSVLQYTATDTSQNLRL